MANEKTPLRSSDEHMPYVFLADPNRAYKKKVRQMQCYTCIGILIIFALAIAVTVTYSVDSEEINELNNSTIVEGKLLLKGTQNVDGNPDIANEVIRSDSNKKIAFNGHPSLGTLKKFSNPSFNDEESLFNCSFAKYSLIDGTCNNLLHPFWGAGMRPYRKDINFGDCTDNVDPNCEKSRRNLTSSQELSSKILKKKKSNPELTPLLVLWGQFIDHDTSSISANIEQPDLFNRASSFLDGNAIYGNTKSMSKHLRKYENGTLVLYITPEKRGLRPISEKSIEECKADDTNSKFCSEIGYKCINEEMNMDSVNLLMTKQHNLVSSRLKKINPHWSDEKLFQEARRITIAQIQHVTYNEFLPLIIGENSSKPMASEYFRGYNASVDPTISISFANAAFKLIYTQLPNNSLTDDTVICEENLVSAFIQRGRNDGLPGYTKWRKFCNLEEPKSFDDLDNIMEEDSLKKIKEQYVNINDIDLIVGAFAEKPKNSGFLGPTAVCLIQDQFRRLKIGDRFWYETNGQPHSFSSDQLQQIRKTTLAKIICENTESISGMQKEALKSKNENNPIVPCSNLENVDITFWTDEKKTFSVETTFSQSANEFISSKNVLNSEKNIRTFSVDGLESSKKNVSKKAVSFSVNSANISAQINGQNYYEAANLKFPVTIPLDDIIDPKGYTASANIFLSGTFADDIFSGTFKLPIKNVSNGEEITNMLEANFSSLVTLKFGGMIEMAPKKVYNCKTLFQSYQKLSYSDSRVLKAVQDENEQCTILLVGTFYQRPFYCSLTPWWCPEGTIFYWSGETKLIFIKPSSPLLLESSAKNTPFFYEASKNDLLKLYASVTVKNAQVFGNLNGSSTMEIFNGKPPVAIYVDNIATANTYDISANLKWSGVPTNDNRIEGKFSLPYNTENESTVPLSGNFSFDIVYKYGGNISIIEQNKDYNCKILFLGNKQATLGKSSDENETCSIIISGSFYEKSFLCYLTPWWCPDEKIFYWSGDAELMIRKKLFPKNDSTILQNIQKKTNSVDFFPKITGYRLGGKVESGWLTVGHGKGIFSTRKTIWSGDFPAEISLPIFWTPSTNDIIEPPTVYNHGILWSCSIFHSTIQGSFSFPQYVGHGLDHSLQWLNGEFSFKLEPNRNISLYNLLIPGVTYNSGMNFHTENSPDPIPFINPQIRDPGIEDVRYSVRAPLVLLGSYTKGGKSFIWNGKFIIVLTQSP